MMEWTDKCGFAIFIKNHYGRKQARSGVPEILWEILFFTDVFEEENKDPELQKAIMKMRRLDRILATKLFNEKEVKKQGKELHQRLWKELKVKLNKGPHL